MQCHNYLSVDNQGVCYNSKLAHCCPNDVNGGALKCVSVTKLAVGGHDVTVGIYEAGQGGQNCTIATMHNVIIILYKDWNLLLALIYSCDIVIFRRTLCLHSI